MAANGLINRAMPSPATGFERDFGDGASFMQGIPPNDGGIPPVQMPGIPRDRVVIPSEVPLWAVGAGGGSGYQQFDEGADEIAMAFKNYLTQNPHAERDAPNVDTFDAFKAGVEFGSGPLFTPTPPPVAEEFGTPYVAPDVETFDGQFTGGELGEGFSAEGFVPGGLPGTGVDPQAGIPPVIKGKPIDVSDIGRRGGP